MPRDRCWHPRLRCSKATRSPQIKMTISANQVENWHWCGRTWAAARRAEISVAQAGWRCRKSPGVPRGEWRNGDLGTVGLFSTLLLLGHAWAGVSHGVTVASSAICACLFALNALGGQSFSFFFFSFLLCAALISRKPRGNKRILGERPRCKNKCIPCKRQASHRNAIWQPAQTCHWIFSDLLGSINIILESSLIVAYRHLLGLQILPS